MYGEDPPVTLLDVPEAAPNGKPIMGPAKRSGEQFALYLAVIVPFLAVLGAVPFAWGWGVSWTDLVLAVVFYYISGLGVTIGYHRLFTHGSFRAKPWLRTALALSGSLAIEGPILQWVADHRRHHAFSDREGDPHSPWRYGSSTGAMLKGAFHAHLGWLFEREQTNADKFAPDLVAERKIQVVDALFPLWAFLSFALPALIGGLITWSFVGAITAFFWAGLIRVFVLHHVTWSINSICHMIGNRPFKSRDKSGNVWPLAILSFGESWHNMHHADPTSARHGVLRGQVDTSARVIWLFEKCGWITHVRWPSAERITRLQAVPVEQIS
jgi:stearoyl-CoA desaturase (delta-9 desaturase)